MNIESTPHIM